jgi:hypothetical protein
MGVGVVLTRGSASPPHGILDVVASPGCYRATGTGVATANVTVFRGGDVAVHKISDLADVTFSLAPGRYVARANGRAKSVVVRAGATRTVNLACATAPARAKVWVFPVLSRQPTSICGTAPTNDPYMYQGVHIIAAFDVTAAQLLATPYGGGNHLERVPAGTLFTECYVSGANVTPSYGPTRGPLATTAIWVLYPSGSQFMVFGGNVRPRIERRSA